LESTINYNEVLNQSQLEAVMTLDGPIQVIAGAGSGKTRTLLYRVARLVESGVPPDCILLLTFTRKAAGEMLERAASLADERCRNVAGGTFPSLAHRVLRSNADLLGYNTSFTMLDRQDMEEVVKALVKEKQFNKNGIRFPKKGTITSIISKAANLEKPVDWLMLNEYSQFIDHTQALTEISELYGKYKKKNQLMDYDDLLILFRQLLSDNKSLLDDLSRRYTHIMVDEYQDTNGIQADIVRLLASKHGNIMIVGDDSQSIYSFRGADYRNMFEFSNIFPNVKTIKLEQNYRSTQPILSLTNAIMDQATEKFTKCLYTERKDGELPKVIDVGSDPEQAIFISTTIKKYQEQGFKLNDMAILFRAAHHSFELELELVRQHIPFVKFGGFKFLESSHIKDLLCHLRVITNKNDAISWGRILRLVKNIGQKKSQSIIDWLKDQPADTFDITKWSGLGKNDESLKSLSGLLGKLADKKITPKKAVELVYEYYDPILKENFDNFPKRQKDLEQLIPMAGRFGNLGSFLDELVLEPPTSSIDLEPSSGDEFVTLSTVHSAKGLEWPIVFIIWTMEGYFPSARAHSSEESIEEERRLMYVASTRAKDRLIMCYPGQECLPSWQMADMDFRTGLCSFIKNLPEGIIDHKSSKPPRVHSSSVWHGTGRNFKRERKSIFSSTDDPNALRPGDRVKHPAFGKGVISKYVDSNKVEVLFRDVGRKLLHLEHTTLEKV